MTILACCGGTDEHLMVCRGPGGPCAFCKGPPPFHLPTCQVAKQEGWEDYRKRVRAGIDRGKMAVQILAAMTAHPTDWQGYEAHRLAAFALERVDALLDESTRQ